MSAGWLAGRQVWTYRNYRLGLYLVRVDCRAAVCRNELGLDVLW
jgi:hypothetical protein